MTFGWLSRPAARASCSKRRRRSGSGGIGGGQHLDRDLAIEPRVTHRGQPLPGRAPPRWARRRRKGRDGFGIDAHGSGQRVSKGMVAVGGAVSRSVARAAQGPPLRTKDERSAPCRGRGLPRPGQQDRRRPLSNPSSASSSSRFARLRVRRELLVEPAVLVAQGHEAFTQLRAVARGSGARTRSIGCGPDRPGALRAARAARRRSAWTRAAWSSRGGLARRIRAERIKARDSEKSGQIRDESTRRRGGCSTRRGPGEELARAHEDPRHARACRRRRRTRGRRR